jgi:NAD(P)-dependent dehydrogenase (short-subunit alcohol dehydrogenase family)
VQDFADKVAVVTGAASGIGRGLAERALQEGMHVVLADVEEAALVQTARELQASGAQVLAVRTDVSKLAEVESLAEQTLSRFGAIHLLCNNAGVAAGGAIWESSLADWEWVLGVNLWGPIHVLRVFVPIMLAYGTDCHVVNTASIVGLIADFPSAPYQVAKHGVVALSENLYYSLAGRNTKMRVSVLCPGWVNTRIVDAERNRPAELHDAPMAHTLSPEEHQADLAMRQAAQTGMSPQLVAEHVFNAIRAEQFYILTHSEYNPLIQQRMEDILQQRNTAER